MKHTNVAVMFVIVLLVLANAAVGIMHFIRPMPVWAPVFFSAPAPVEVPIAGLPAPRLAATTTQKFNKPPIVTYKIVLSDGKYMEGTAIADGEKKIDISAVGKLPENSTIIYDLQMQHRESGAPVNLTVNLDPVEGRATVEGKGFQRFESVQFGNDRVNITVKADWAGIIRSQADWRLDSSGAPSFKLVFFQANDIARDFNPNPLLVKAVAFGTANVNCNGRRVSVCINSHRQALLTNIQAIVQTWKTMTDQLTAVMMEHSFIMGQFMDAKMQLETQRLYQEQIAEAHRDYHPSDTMCRVGSFMKSVATTEARATLNKEAMNSSLNQIYMNTKNRSSAEGYGTDVVARLLQFRRVYCDPRDNSDGLALMCEHDQNRDSTAANYGQPVPGGVGAVTPTPTSNQRKNKDIDYTRTTDFPLTLDIDFTDNVLTDDEEDVFALARNIYWESAGNPAPEKDLAWDKSERFIDQRSYLAKQNVAHNTLLEIASMKSRSNPTFGVNSGWNFMKSMMREFGLTDPEIHDLVGNYPSYYAQMEVMTKKMFQNPDFYTNLYDKPANIERINASLTAIQLMQQRDFLESRQRTEMLNSLILESALTKDFNYLNMQLTYGATQVGK